MKPRHLLIPAFAMALFLIAASVVLAADGNKSVGLVIAFPDGTTHSEAVSVPITATTYDVLQRAKIELVGGNGSFGPAVCSINKTGCPASNCFCDTKHFWAFYQLNNSTGQWVVSQQGVGAAVPADGEVVGFAWSEMDAQYNPLTKPPVMTMQQITEQPGAAAQAPATTGSAAAGTRGKAPAAPAVMPSTGGAPVPLAAGTLGLALLLLGAALRTGAFAPQSKAER